MEKLNLLWIATRKLLKAPLSHAKMIFQKVPPGKNQRPARYEEGVFYLTPPPIPVCDLCGYLFVDISEVIFDYFVNSSFNLSIILLFGK